MLEAPKKGHLFIDEEIYLQQKTNKEKVAEERKTEKQKRLIKKTEKHELLKQKLIKEYGNKNGNFISQGIVKLGMTKAMCKLAWGKPLWTNKITTQNENNESWFYGYGYSLHFKNGILKVIHE